MSEIPGTIGLTEPNPDSEAVPRWKFALTLGKISLFLMIWIVVTCIVIPNPDDKLDISVVTVQPNETLVRRLEMPNKATMIPVGEPIDARFLKCGDNVSTQGLRVEWWDSGMNQTIPCTAVWSVFLEDSKENYLETYKLFEWTGNETILSHDRKCEYAVSLFKVTDASPLLTHLWLIYGALLLLELYILIAFEMTTNMYLAVLVATTGIAILAALGSKPTEQMYISWDLKH